jgi:hypothetical protein
MNNEQFENHLVAFIDILGFRDALRDKENLNTFLGLIAGFVNLNSNFAMHVENREDKSQIIKLRPSITAFSDNIAISYSLTALERQNVNGWSALHALTENIASIASKCMEAGLLIRGGITIGPLYHRAGVIIGPALVEAYEIESQIAIYPRVVLSKAALRLNDVASRFLLNVDADGLHYVNYFRSLVTRIENGRVNLEIARWLRHIDVVIENNLTKYQANGDLRRLAKWIWFQRHFEKGKENFDPEFLKWDGEPHSPKTGEHQ